jgi:hypothetical protein
MSQESNQYQTKSECPDLSDKVMGKKEALKHLIAFAKDLAAQNVNRDIVFALCQLCVLPEPTVVSVVSVVSGVSANPTNEVLQVQKTYEFREEVAKASCLVANDEATRQVASYEVDRFDDYVHHTPTVNHGFQPVLKTEIPRDWECKSW